MLNKIKYFFVFLTPITVFISYQMESYWSFFAIVFNFGFLPFIELFTKVSTKNFTLDEEAILLRDKFFDGLLWLMLPLQYALGLVFLFHIANSTDLLIYKIGITSAYGFSCGVLGINAAHELGHRQTWYEQFMSKALLLSTFYMHFFIEHNRGHHTHVSTDEDPASARYGETVYAFHWRSIWGSWWSAWAFERKRLDIEKQPFWSFHNEMIVYQLLQLALMIAIAYFFGIISLCFYLAAAFVGVLLLETVNYIEHYGLRREKKGSRYERTMPIHSWNSNHPIGRVVLLELSRHSDHHFLSNRKYQILRHHDDSPQMPTGYPGMMLLALIPPLWFRVMHQLIRNIKKGSH